MYLKLKFLKDNVEINLDEFCNNNKDISISYAVEKNINSIVRCIMNDFSKDQSFDVILLHKNEQILSKRYPFFINNSFHYKDFYFLTTALKDFFNTIPHYNIIINEKTEKIEQLISSETKEIIDNSHYKSFHNRSYRKISVFDQPIILKCDIYE